MIVISVSLVLIGLLVLSIGNNYHFSGDLMAKQEVDSMTLKKGYSIILFDYTQPIGAKLKFLDSTPDFQTAVQLKHQHEKDYLTQASQVLIFDTSIMNNTNSISLAEVYAMTPTTGYNVVSFNTVYPVGARLSGLKQDLLLENATIDNKKSSDQNFDVNTKILTFTSSFEDNLKQIIGNYDPKLIYDNINDIKSMPPKMAQLSPPTPVPTSITNQTSMHMQNVTIAQTNTTKDTIPSNAAFSGSNNQTTNNSSTSITAQTARTNNTNNTNTTHGSMSQMNANATHANQKIKLSEKIGISASG